ncbi:MAG: hypothetical protein HOQ24_11030, partial [Mycobacteriaceae bacterium]|nr:hypothetical protein [Mycobacteriaceae bacterium]
SSGGVSDRGRAELLLTLEEDFGIAEVLDAPSYDLQCRLINARLWDRSVPDTCPRPVYVEDEQVAAVLLSRDLHDTHSLIYPLIFDPDIRAQLVRALDGVPTCWRTSLLENGDQRGGSHLFWALSPKGHRVPVVLRPGCGSDRLVEMSAGGDSRSWDVSPEPLTEAVAEGELLPTAPLSFMAVSFARGIACVGGFYQFDYLPRIYAAVRTTLDQWGLRSRLAEVPTDYYLAGIQPILARDPSGSCIPLGPVALAADGPLTEDEIGAMLRMAMGEAQTAAMAEILGELLAVREVARSDARLLDEALTAARTVVIRELAP